MLAKIKNCLKNIGSELGPPIIKKTVKNFLISVNVIKKPYRCFLDPSVGSHSQYQEDLLLDALLSPRQKGFYVDVGANNPELLSNTKRFYDKGWNGINVEPIADNFKLFQLQRPRDINLNVGVDSKAGEMTFYHSARDGGVYSGFDKKTVMKSVKEEDITATVVPIMRLADILSEHLEDGAQIDFMSIDVEGCELGVLNGNDWTRFRPHLIIIELGDIESSIAECLREKGYNYIFCNGTNGIFIDSKS